MVYWSLPLLAYLIGSLSSAILVSMVLRLPDPRNSGSNNPGATNILRLGSKTGALITLIGDIAKGLLPILAVKTWISDESLLLASLGLGAHPRSPLPDIFQIRWWKRSCYSTGGVLSSNSDRSGDSSYNMAGIHSRVSVLIIGSPCHSNSNASICLANKPKYLFYSSQHDCRDSNCLSTQK